MTQRDSSQPLYKVVPAEVWHAAESDGEFTGTGIDLDDGFIHLSSQSQVVATVSRYFSGKDGLLLVAINAGKLGETLRWEPSRDDEYFPHVYGPISMDAVMHSHELLLNDDGSHQFPF